MHALEVAVFYLCEGLEVGSYSMTASPNRSLHSLRHFIGFVASSVGILRIHLTARTYPVAA